MREKELLERIRWMVMLLIVGLVISGITAFPICSEIIFLQQWMHKNHFNHNVIGWIDTVANGVSSMEINYPFIFYGTDWLAFAHVVIAILFIGVWKNPAKNKWICSWGLITCMLIFPLALIAGPVRGIPLFHQFIDCSFGIFGGINTLDHAQDDK